MSARRSILVTALLAAVGAALIVPGAASGRSTPRPIEPLISNNYINSKMIINNSILSNDIRNLSLRTEDLANRIITADKIAQNGIKLENLAPEIMASVQKMIDDTVTAKIAALSIPAGPRAYGRVKADGTVDTAVSSNISARRVGNKYCVAVTGVADPTKIAPVVSASNDSAAAYAVVTSMHDCSANEFGVGVYFYGSDFEADFNVYVP